MKSLTRLGTALAITLLLCACASGPPAPDWQTNAFEALKGYSSFYLSGNTRLADLEMNRARTEMARTGRADMLARAELTRCAVRVASLEFDHCATYQPLAADAPAPEQTYAAFLSGQWTNVNPGLLPPHHRALVLSMAGEQNMRPGQTGSALATMPDPLARLVAAGVLLQRGRVSPADIELATETASSQGWRRPLLAWLGVQLKRAQDGGDAVTAQRIQRRMDLVLQTQAQAPTSTSPP